MRLVLALTGFATVIGNKAALKSVQHTRFHLLAVTRRRNKLTSNEGNSNLRGVFSAPSL